MSGLDRHTMRPIGPEAHLAQSVADILTTPLGTLVMRRDYGSELPDLIDRPINGTTRVDLFQAVAEALDAWEPRLDLTRVEILGAQAGTVELRLHGTRAENAVTIDVTLGLSESARLRAQAAGGAL